MLLDGHVSYWPKGHAQKRLLNSLALSEKLPNGIIGSADIDHQISQDRLAHCALPQRAANRRKIPRHTEVTGDFASVQR
jgi:hypothetical protein